MTGPTGPALLRLIGPSGPFARALAGYELRAGQLEMAEAVGRALEREHVLICEAGTGTGKTLAYLVPAILSGKRVVISTATRALQDQIFDKDLPLIERALGVPVASALMKGLANYVCLRRLAAFRASADSARHGLARSLPLVDGWVETSATGDISELTALPEDDPVWREVTSSPETRVGTGCEFHDECFVTRRQRRAESARIIVVNHHLFFADLALRGPHPGRVIPDYDAVVFDEAHQLEDIATEFFGVTVSRSRIERLLRDLEQAVALAGSGPLLTRDLPRLVDGARQASEQLWQALASLSGTDDGRVTLERGAWVGDTARAWHALDSALEALAGFAQATRPRASERPRSVEESRQRARSSEVLEVVARRAEQMREQLAQIVESEKGSVTWLDVGARTASLSSAPVDVSGLLRERVFLRVPAVVLTSATLAGKLASAPSSAPTSEFSYLRSRLGLDADDLEVEETIVASPFDFERQALFYTPEDLPPPSDAGFIDAACGRIRELVEITGGGCFVLTTSLRSMRILHQRLKSACPDHQVLVQGEAPKAALIDAFRRAEDAILVATMSFWQGVDVPGRALRLVVLEKIPFAVPTDPMLVARGALIEERGGKPFLDLHVPAAAIALKQGFGRLIRTRTDAGIVALLDERVRRKGYGKKLLATLPPVRRSERIEEVRRFWDDLGVLRS